MRLSLVFLIADVLKTSASMKFDLQPVEEFGWPTCAGRAEEVGHDQKFRPPQNVQNKKNLISILSDSSLPPPVVVDGC